MLRFCARAAPALLALLPLSAAAGVPLASLDQSCALLTQRLAVLGFRLSSCTGAGLQVAPRPSAQGQPLLWRDYPPSPPSPLPRRILLVGGLHGDELSSVIVTFDWMERLGRERFQPFYWRVIPVLNPDGLLAQPPQRMNGRGVDLNRNFDTPDWNARALPYWEQRTGRDPRRYPGPHPLSEPESRWLAAQIARFQPDAVIQVHAPYGLLDFDGPQAPPERVGYLKLRQLGAYPGSLGNFVGHHLGKPVLTLELPNAGRVPAPSQAARMWSDLLTWLDDHVPPRPPDPAEPQDNRAPWLDTLRDWGLRP